MREEVPLARRAIGSAHAAERRWPEAIAEYRLVLSMIPFDDVTRQLLIDTLVNQGTAMGRAGQTAGAIAAFRQALELDPSQRGREAQSGHGVV